MHDKTYQCKFSFENKSVSLGVVYILCQNWANFVFYFLFQIVLYEFGVFMSPSGRSFCENCCLRSVCRATKPALYLQESLKKASHLT